MNALYNTARTVENSWCKSSMRDEAIARDAGDSYCAAGALAANLIPQGTILTIDGEHFGPAEDVYEWDRLYFASKLALARLVEAEKNGDEDAVIEADAEHDKLVALTDEQAEKLESVYSWLAQQDETKYLLEVIGENYSDRVNVATKVLDIFAFNDHQDTTREEVIAVLEKAAVKYDEQEAFRDDEIDELVNDIRELVDA